MICKKCGKEISDESIVCNYCANPVEKEVEKAEEVVATAEPVAEEVNPIVENVNVNQTVNANKDEANNKAATKLATWSLILLFGVPFILAIIAVFFKDIAEIIAMVGMPTYLISIVLMVIARVKSPKNVLAKIVMWIYIILTIISMILVVWIVKYFIESCQNGVW